MGRFIRQLSMEKNAGIPYPYPSRIQRHSIKWYKESHFTLIKGIIHKEILTIMTFSAASNTALKSIKQTRNQDINRNNNSTTV